MNSIKLGALVLTLGFAAGIGCGSDDGSSVDAPTIGSTGGSTTRHDAAAGGAGGAGGTTTAYDGPIATGGSGGGPDAAIDNSINSSIDSSVVLDAGEAGRQVVDSLTGEVNTVTDICAGLNAAACDSLIRNAQVDPTVVAQDVPNTNPPAYTTCNQ